MFRTIAFKAPPLTAFLGVVFFSYCISPCSYGSSYYSSRPRMESLSVGAEPPAVLTPVFFRSILDFVTELRILYPAKRRVYLGRDGELLYDLDTLLDRGGVFGKSEPGYEPLLINISRASRDSDHLVEYLRDQGVVGEVPSILIDTGYEGSVIDAINEQLDEAGIENLPAHLVSSVHTKSPSSRVATAPFIEDPEVLHAPQAKHKEAFLDWVDHQVDTIEDLAHFTETSNRIRRNPETGKYDAYSDSDASAEQQHTSIELQKDLLRYMRLEPGLIRRAQRLVAVLKPFILNLHSGKVQANAVKEVADLVSEESWNLFWLDLRESIAKGTVRVPGENAQSVWNALGGAPDLFDLEPDEKRAIQKRERKIYNGKEAPPAAAPRRTLVEVLLDFHAEQMEVEQARKRTKALKAFRESLDSGGVLYRNSLLPLGGRLGEGVRAEVFALGPTHVLKVPFEGDDTRYIDVEAMVAEFLKRNLDRYGIQTLPILKRGELGTYLIRPRVAPEFLGETILRQGLSKPQMEALKVLHERAKRFAADTGVGLDIKYDNLAWIDDEWVLFDVGPRTSYGPYAFTLDVPKFKDFFRLWAEDLPREDGLAIESVVQDIRERGGNCAEIILMGGDKPILRSH